MSPTIKQAQSTTSTVKPANSQRLRSHSSLDFTSTMTPYAAGATAQASTIDHKMAVNDATKAVGLKKFCPELRQMIFKCWILNEEEASQNERPDAVTKVPNLIKALRPQKDIYLQALDLYVRSPAFHFHLSLQNWDFAEKMPLNVWKLVRKLTIHNVPILPLSDHERPNPDDDAFLVKRATDILQNVTDLHLDIDYGCSALLLFFRIPFSGLPKLRHFSTAFHPVHLTSFTAPNPWLDHDYPTRSAWESIQTSMVWFFSQELGVQAKMLAVRPCLIARTHAEALQSTFSAGLSDLEAFNYKSKFDGNRIWKLEERDTQMAQDFRHNSEFVMRLMERCMDMEKWRRYFEKKVDKVVFDKKCLVEFPVGEPYVPTPRV